MLKTFSGRPASQNEFELRSFIALLQERGVTSYAEIGARHGDTFHEVMTSLPAGSRGVALDLPGALWGKSTSERSLKAACSDLTARGYLSFMVLGDSQKAEVKESLYQIHGRFGAILIDGDHTLEGVTRDWELYRHMASVIAFHDIVGTGQKEKVHGRAVEVPILWDRLKGEHRTVEFIAPGSKMGIGVVLCD